MCTTRSSNYYMVHPAQLVYEPGANNIADGWSRLPAEASDELTKFVEDHVQFVAKEMELLTLKEICEEGKKDEELKLVASAIENG